MGTDTATTTTQACGAVAGADRLHPGAICVRDKGHGKHHGTERTYDGDAGYFWYDSEPAAFAEFPTRSEEELQRARDLLHHRLVRVEPEVERQALELACDLLEGIELLTKGASDYRTWVAQRNTFLLRVAPEALAGGRFTRV